MSVSTIVVPAFSPEILAWLSWLGFGPVVTDQTATQSWVAGQSKSLTLAANTFSDNVGLAMTYQAHLANGSALPSWLSFNATTRTFVGTAPTGLASIDVVVQATDAIGLARTEQFKIAIGAGGAIHSAPVLAIQTANQIWAAGVASSLTLAPKTFTDPQASALTYSATLAGGGALPNWLKFNAATDSFSGTDAASTGPVTIRVTATNGYGLQASENFTLSLASAPVVAAQTAGQTWTQGQAVSFTLPKGTFTDPQGAPLSLTATQSTGAALPSWLKFNATTGAFTGTAPTGTAGFSIKISATDTYGLSNSETFSVATPAPVAPTPTPAVTSGLVINVTYDGTTGAAPAGFFTAVQAAVKYIESEFTNAMTLNLKVGYGSVNGSTIGTGALGESQTSYDKVSYATLRNALASHANQPDQQTALATLSTTSPVGSANFIVANAEARALGLANANGTTLDGSIGISSTYAMDWDPTNRAVAGQYDAVGVLEHEITEVMGRTGSLGTNSGAYTPLDLFRYTSAGVRDLIPGAGNFSINGQTMLQAFNNPLTGGDATDWASSVVGDSFGSGRTGVASLVSAVDLREMNVLGYTRASLTS